MMIVGITGASGFIGRGLVERHIERGDKIRLLSRSPSSALVEDDSVQYFRADLSCDGSAFESFTDGVDILYHCAGEIRDASRMRSTHVYGTQRLVEAARRRIGRWVQLSSVGVYGRPRFGDITESSKWNPQGLYEETKAESDRIVMNAADEGAFRYSILRPAIVFGAGMTNPSLYQMIGIVNRGLFFFIGRPGASANYVHVSNVTEALYQCATKPEAENKAFNLSDWRSIESFVGTIAEALDRPVPTRRLPENPARLVARTVGRLPGFPLTQSRVDALTTRARYPYTRIEQELGFQWLVTVEDGLRDMVATSQRV